MCFKEIKRHGGKITLNMFVKFIPARCSSVRQTSLKEISFTAQVVTLIITNIIHLSQIISYQTFQNFEHCGVVFFCVVCSVNRDFNFRSNLFPASKARPCKLPPSPLFRSSDRCMPCPMQCKQ